MSNISSTVKTNTAPNCNTLLTKNLVSINTHAISQQLDNKTLPPSEELFEEYQDLDFALLDKKYTLQYGDYSQCPAEHLPALHTLLQTHADRFSTSKLDLEAGLFTKPIYQQCLIP